MSYKVVRYANGEVACFGPNTEQYDPGIPAGTAITIEANIPAKSVAALEAEATALAKQQLESIDMKSIRELREYIAAKADAPTRLKAYELDALAERAKIK